MNSQRKGFVVEKIRDIGNVLKANLISTIEILVKNAAIFTIS